MFAHPQLFDHERVKNEYSVDAYLVDLGMDAELLVNRSAYWYSLWSHRRNQVWKGFVQIKLAPNEDATAMATLTRLNAGGRP